MELTANQRPFLYFPLRHHFEQNFHVRHRLKRYGAGRAMDFDRDGPPQIAAAIADEIGREVDYLPSPPTAPRARRPDRRALVTIPHGLKEGNLMPASVGFIVIDSVNPDELARFWCALLDVQVDINIGQGQFIVLSATAEGLVVGFQQVPRTEVGQEPAAP